MGPFIVSETGLKPPCGTHCDKRKVGCHGTCEAWKIFLKQKEEKYEERKIQAAGLYGESDSRTVNKRMNSYLNWKSSKRGYGSNGRGKISNF